MQVAVKQLSTDVQTGPRCPTNTQEGIPSFELMGLLLSQSQRASSAPGQTTQLGQLQQLHTQPLQLCGARMTASSSTSGWILLRLQSNRLLAQEDIHHVLPCSTNGLLYLRGPFHNIGARSPLSRCQICWDVNALLLHCARPAGGARSACRNTLLQVLICPSTEAEGALVQHKAVYRLHLTNNKVA